MNKEKLQKIRENIEEIGKLIRFDIGFCRMGVEDLKNKLNEGGEIEINLNPHQVTKIGGKRYIFVDSGAERILKLAIALYEQQIENATSKLDKIEIKGI